MMTMNITEKINEKFGIPAFLVRMQSQQGTSTVCIPWVEAIKAFAVYRELYGREQSLVTIYQRGGFSAEEMDMFHPDWRQYIMKSGAPAGLKKEELNISDYKEELQGHNKLVRELDLIINGENAATQASLVDLVDDVRKLVQKSKRNDTETSRELFNGQYNKEDWREAKFQFKVRINLVVPYNERFFLPDEKIEEAFVKHISLFHYGSRMQIVTAEKL